MPARLLPYIPRLTVDWARRPDLPEDDNPAWQAIDATMVFGDVSGFTKMSERLARHGKVGAEEIADAINACFEELLGVANRAGGSLLKFGGDALLLLFDGPDHALRAAHAAVGMRARLREVGRLSTSAGQVVLRISIGVHTGVFHLFLVGHSHRELVVAGPAVTATVDAESTASAGEIVMSAATAAVLPASSRGPARGRGFLLRAPQRAAPKEPIVPLDLDDDVVARYVPTAIRTHLLGGGSDPVHRDATVAFLHFDGTDDIVEREGPSYCAEVLHAAVRRAQEVADRHDVTFLGTDIDHDGGKIIVVAGVPRRVGDDEERLLTALREVLDAELPLGLRIGVHAGPVFAGDVGPPYRRTFTVMGDTVNLAARLMAKAVPDQLLATAGVLGRSQRPFATTPQTPFSVKGKRRPVTAFAVGEPMARRTRSRRQAVLPLAGVDAEVASFDADLAVVTGGGGRVIEIVGESGSGKSRLVEEFRRRATDVPCLSISCESYEATSPYAPFWLLGRQLLDLDADAERHDVARHLDDSVRRHTPELLPMLPLLGTPLDLELAETPETAALQPEFRRHAVEQAATTFFTNMLPAPVLLVIEDVHHMDEASQALLGHVIDALADRPALLCLTRRDTGEGFVTSPAGHVRSLRLRPWSIDVAVDALTRAGDEVPLLPYEIRVLAERSGGNPLFLEELCRARLAGASLDSLPTSIDDALTAQIDRLSPPARQTLRCAAVLGQSFLQRELLELLRHESEDPDFSSPRTVDDLQDFLIVEGSDVVRFRSAIARDCAYEELPYRRRRELHGRAGKAIAARLGEDADTEAEVLSLHFFHAQDFDQAWHFACVAGRRALKKYANVDAASHFESALAAARRLPELRADAVASAWEALGDARERSGAYDGAVLAYRRARRLLANDPVAQAGCCLKEAWIPERVGRFSEAVRWIRRGLRAVEGVTGVDAGRRRAQLQVWYAAVRQAQGYHREAITWCEKAIFEGRESGDADAEAHALFILDWAWTSLGQSDRATNSQRALEIYTELGDLGGQAVVLNNLGVFAYFRGHWDEAVSFYQRGYDARLATGADIDAAMGTCNIGEILANQGHYEEAEKRFHDALRVWRAAGYRYGIGYALLLRGQLAARTGDFADAHSLFDSARHEFNLSGLAADVRLVDARIAECLVFEGRTTEALEIVDGLLDGGESDGLNTESPLLHRVRGCGLLHEGDLSGASTAFDVSLQSARTIAADYEIALTLVAQLRLAHVKGDEVLAAELDAQSTVLLDGLGVVNVTPPREAVLGEAVS